jgi:hypothetical protein
MAKDERISDIFYYFSEHTDIESGRKVGRKIGTVQEILVRKFLLTDPRVMRAIVYEPRVQGRSRATHKVEFVFYQPLEVISVARGGTARFGSFEGLKVLVEQAPTGSHRTYAKVRVSFADELGPSLRANVNIVYPLPNRNGRRYGLTVSSVQPNVTEVCLLDMTSPVASIESKRVGAQRFKDSDKLGAGIQTIEKAKQASLVAVDFDLNFNETLLCQSPPGPRKYKSIVALGNGVHWTEHDLAVLETYVDHTYLVRDEAIIRYAEYVRNLAAASGEEFFVFFMAYFNGMTKTPPDTFKVTAEDFPPMRPADSPPLLDVVAAQLQPFPIR